MRRAVGVAIVCFALVASAATAATKNVQQPDPEMLKMLEFLREMEMIRQIDMLKEMQQVESVGEPGKVAAPPKSAPLKRKETVR